MPLEGSRKSNSDSCLQVMLVELVHGSALKEGLLMGPAIV